MKYQYMPMFWGDFFANTLHLSSQEIGAYVLLIAHAWEHEGYIPYHGAQRIARVNNLHWPRIREVLMPFFEWEKDAVTDTPSRGICHRVRSELTKADEISNKRKGAAMQMHSKSKANGHANGAHLHLQLPIEMLSVVREASDPTEKPTPADPKPVAEKKPPTSGLYRKPTNDEANDYRSPPPTKSNNVLEPIPERPAFRRP